VQRGLPKSSLGRVIFSWFNPGPGTGFFFAVSNLLAMAAICLFTVYCGTMLSGTTRGGPTPANCAEFIALLASYAIIYLGIMHLFIRLIRRFAQVTVATSLLINILVLLGGCGIPQIVRRMTDYSHQRPYTLLHISDPFWSCAEVIDAGGPSMLGEILLWILAPTAAGVLLLSLIKVGSEIQVVRAAIPPRVEEEEAAIAAMLHPPQYQPKDPWDERGSDTA
jgi:hypothetical protein